MKKLVSLLTVIAMLLCLLAACGSEPANTETEGTEAQPTEGNTEPAAVNIWDGYYFLNIDNSMLCFIHFYEDGTYYGSYFGGSAMEAGTWELVNEPTTYNLDDNGDGMGTEDETEAESTQTIIMTNYLTGTPVRVAYVDDTLMDMSLAGMANNRYLAHDPEYAYNPDTDEIAIQLYVYYANNDIGSTFVLNHNKTFEDVTGDMFDSGTWEMTGAGEYALTYDFGGSATLVANGATATLTKDDGTVIELKDDYKDEDLSAIKLMSLTCEGAQVGLPMGVNLRIDGFKDGSCVLIVEVAQIGAELVADKGTYEVSGAMKPTFHFETAGDIEGTPDYSTAGENGIVLTMTYAADVSVEFNGSETPLTINSDLTGLYNPNATAEDAAPVVVTTMRLDDAQVGLPMGVGLRIDCYDDGTAKVVVEISQMGAEYEIDNGTYEVSPTMKFTFNFETAGEVIGEPDYASATDTGLDINVHYVANTELTANDTTMPLTIDSVLTGTYVPG